MIPASVAIVVFLVVAPTLVFAFGLLQPLPGAIMAMLTLIPMAALARATDWRGRPDRPILLGALAVAFTLTLFSGIGHFFWQTDDWMVRDAMLFDLVRNSWPVAYATPAGAGLLRAPLGMYLAPAAIGKLGGTGIAQAALFVQNTILLGLCIYVLARVQEAGRARIIAIALFVVFSGADCIGWAQRRLAGLEGLDLPHLEPWSGQFQYASNVTEIFWTPHHALGGWALVAAYLAWRTGGIRALQIAPLWVAACFWSPLVALGALPFLAFAFVCDAVDGKLRGGDFALAAIAGAASLPLAYFLTRDTGAIEKGFIDLADSQVLRGYVGLLGLEVAPFLALAWEGRDKADRRAGVELGLIAASLVLIPLYRLGYANDFVMRVSIPALTLLCARSVPALATLGQQPVRQRIIALAIVLVGAVTPAVEIWRNLGEKAFPASACNVMESLQDGPYAGSPLDYYIAGAASLATPLGLFTQPSSAPLKRAIANCWPGRTFVYGPPSPTK